LGRNLVEPLSRKLVRASSVQGDISLDSIALEDGSGRRNGSLLGCRSP
jgi:hypothetical protein